MRVNDAARGRVGWSGPCVYWRGMAGALVLSGDRGRQGVTPACPASSAWRGGYQGARVWSGYGEVRRAPRGRVARVRAPVTSPMPLAAYLGVPGRASSGACRRPRGQGLVLAIFWDPWRATGHGGEADRGGKERGRCRGGGLAFGCGGAQAYAVSPDYSICLVSPAATMASLGWSPAWGPDVNKGGGPRASLR
ncbi:hypothetical protein QYE76_022667 [Lolium multiflorum]|uniref:Uncharacterized protein n=1 Tax=Lolium multiflorum TaxID=4521 RepID=A0AAD8VTZ7_LOLMU|nr:hypothetical protein QYE76_022667 [Lolium multiflorum]